MSSWIERLLGRPRLNRGLVDPLGPLFVSYRQSDGSELARQVAWSLRSAGVPVWRDDTDLPPGDTSRRLDDALNSGLAGGILAVTPDIRKSRVVRKIELPRLLSLEGSDGRFSLAIANTIRKPGSNGLDYEAPDRLVGTKPGTLGRLKQYPVETSEQLRSMAREMVLARAALVRSSGEAVLGIDLQTRAAPRALGRRAALVVRTPPPPPTRRVPPREAWDRLQDFLAYLPDVVEESGCSQVEITGGAHLSAAFAFGAAMPETARWPVTVVDQHGGVWGDASGQSPALRTELTELARGQPRSVAAFVDLLPTPPPEDTFGSHMSARPDEFSAQLRVSLNDGDRIDPTVGGSLASEVAGHLRRTAAHMQTSRVALFLRMPFPVALILGRLLNTLELELYEWEDADGTPVYVPVIDVASGRGGSPIIRVHPGARPS